jgi:multiple sugar transport system substrate-binding protein
MKRTRVAAIAAATVSAAASLLIAGCSSGGSAAGSGDANTITFMAAAYSEGTQAYWQNLIAQFEKKYPGKHVDLSVVSWDDYDQKISTLLANSQQPDLLNYNTWAGYASSNLLYPITDITTPQMRQDFLSTFTQNDSMNGTAYALPFIASARALYYNKKLFAKAGITQPPATWAEFEADAKKITAAGSIGYALPLGSEEAQGEFSLWSYNGGGDWQDNGKWAINSPANIKTAEFLNKLVNVDKVTEANPQATNRTDGAWRLFADGRAGMVFGFPGTFEQMLQQAGMTKADYGVASLPTESASIPSTTLGVQDVLEAFKGKVNKTATIKDFLSFFYEPQNYDKFLTQEGFLPTTKSGSSALVSDPELGPYIKLLPDAKFEPTNDPGWNKVVGAVKQQIGGIVEPGADPASVLNQLQATAEAAK